MKRTGIYWLAAAAFLSGLSIGSHPSANHDDLGSAAGFTPSRFQEPSNRYVALEMHTPSVRVSDPTAPDRDATLPHFDDRDLGKSEHGPSFRARQTALSDRPAETENSRVDGMIDLASSLDATDELDDPVSRALQNWGWLSREVLDSRWRQPETVDDTLFLESLTSRNVPTEDQWPASPLEKMYGKPLQGLPSDEVPEYELWREPSQEISRRLLGRGVAAESDEELTLKRWRPSSGPLEESGRP